MPLFSFRPHRPLGPHIFLHLLFVLRPHTQQDRHHEGVDGHVHRQNDRQEEMRLPEREVDAADREEEHHDGSQRPVHREAHVHEKMVDVGAVGIKNVVPREPALHGHTRHVQDGNQKQRDGDEHLLLAAVDGSVTISRAKTNPKQQTDDFAT